MIKRAAQILIVSLGLSFSLSTTTYAQTGDKPCYDIEAIFARGSGDGGETKQDPPSTKFEETIGKYLEDTYTTYNVYHLGTESYDNFQYPHTGIFGSWTDAGKRLLFLFW